MMRSASTHSSRWRRWPLLFLALSALAGSGCVSSIPRIDPTGRSLLVIDPPAGSTSVTTIPPPGTGSAVPGAVAVSPTTPIVTTGPTAPIVAVPAPPVVLPSTPDTSLSLGPTDTIAPVGSEVILVASVAGSQSVLQPRQRVEWTLAPSGVGQIAVISQVMPLDWLFGGRGAQKIAANYAVSATSTRNYLLNRGTAIVTDDIPITAGQTWVSVTSSVEGISFVNALAPQLGAWEARQKTARVYWIDAQWSFPPSTAAPGSTQTLSTSVLRLSDRTPLVGYRVRYSIVGGSSASLGTGDAQEVEIETNATGEAAVELTQASPSAGTTEVRTQIIRPASLGGFDGRTLDVAAGIARVAWGGTSTAPPPTTPVPTTPIPPTTAPTEPPVTPTSAQVTLTLDKPLPAIVGDEVAFLATITNDGATATGDLILRDEYGAGLQFERPDNPIQTTLASIPPGQTARFSIPFTTTSTGTLSHTLTVLTQSGQVIASGVGTVLVTDPPLAPPPAESPYEPAPTQPAQPEEPAPAETPPSNARKNDLSVEITGPLSAKRGDVATFRIAVTNNGTEALHNVTVLNYFDPQLVPTKVSGGAGGHRRVGEQADIEWNALLELAPGATKVYQVLYRCEAPTESACASVSVRSQEQVSTDDKACLAIEAANTNLVATLSDRRDPVSVGSAAVYELRITNAGQVADSNVVVRITLPPELEFQPTGTSGPGRVGETLAGSQVEFQPLATLAAGEAVSFYLAAKGRQPGTARVVASIRSSGSPQPVEARAETQVQSAAP